MATELDTHYFLGLLAGEGTFVTNMHKDPRLTIGIRMRPECRIEMHDVDHDMLVKLHEGLGFGVVMSRGNNMTGLQFRSQDDVGELIDLIESADSNVFEESHKFECYERWREVARALLDGEHTQDHERAKELVDQACGVNQRFGGQGNGPGHWKAIIEKSQDLSR
jgi:hypothetical protein